MQRLVTLLLAVLAALSFAGCSSVRNPSASDGGTGYGTRPGGGSQPSPGTGNGGGSNQPTPAPTTRHALSWDGNVLRLRLIGPVFKAWKDGGGEIDVDLDHGWSGQYYIPFNASDNRKNGIAMARSGNELSLRKDGTIPWIGGSNVVGGDRFNVKYTGPSGAIAWHKYEDTDLQGVNLESDQPGSQSKSFRIPTAGII